MIGILLLTPSCTDHQSGRESPSDVYTAYYNALEQGDVEVAAELTAGSQHIPTEVLWEAVLDLSKGAKMGRLAVLPTTFAEKTEGDCAVVICDGNKIHINDYRAIYLLQEEEGWKVLWTATIWDLEAHALSDSQKDRFRLLERWFEAEKIKLPPRAD